MKPIATSLAAATLALCAVATQAQTLVGLTSANELARFDAASPGMAMRVAITGLDAGDRLVGIDLRPTNGLIYGISLSNRIYTIDEFSGAASFVATLSAPVISADRGWGIDFNPERDFAGAASLRVVSTAGDNLAVNANTGAVANLGNLIAPGHASVAYSNSVPGAAVGPTTTALYYINSLNDTLSFASGAFNAPTIMTIGALGVDVLRAGGLELTASNTAFAALNTDGSGLNTGLYQIDLSSGMAQWRGDFNGTLTGLTVSAVPEPASLALLASGLAAVAWRRRRTA